MKITKLILAFLVCFVFVNCTTPPVPVPKPALHRMAVNEAFLKNRSSGELEWLNFYISVNTEFMLYNFKNQDGVGHNGIYYTNTLSDYSSHTIRKDDPGKYVSNINDWEMIQVRFPNNKDILLTFAKVMNTDQYELVFARDCNTLRSLDLVFLLDKPLLEIKHINGSDPSHSFN